MQAEGHIANDSGDCASELAGLSLVAIPHAGFTAAAIEAEIAPRRDRPRRRQASPPSSSSRRFGAASAQWCRSRAGGDRGARPRAWHRHPPRRRAPLHRRRLPRPPGARPRRGLRHGLRVALQVFRRALWRGSRRPGLAHRRALSRPPALRRRAQPDVADRHSRRCRARRHGRELAHDRGARKSRRRSSFDVTASPSRGRRSAPTSFASRRRSLLGSPTAPRRSTSSCRKPRTEGGPQRQTSAGRQSRKTPSSRRSSRSLVRGPALNRGNGVFRAAQAT